jgi:uncharacterized iron-regulated membrane protein
MSLHHVGMTLGLSAVILFVLLAVAVVVRFIGFCLADLDARPAVAVLSRDAWRMLIIFCIPLGGLFYLRFGRTIR